MTNNFRQKQFIEETLKSVRRTKENISTLVF